MHPILFELGTFYIGTYGLFVAAGMLTGVFYGAARARKRGVEENLILDLAFVCFLVGLLGARLTYILVEFDDFLKNPSHYIFTRQGFVFAGGMICGSAVAVWFLRRRKAPLWVVCDSLAPAVPVAHIFGRIGCFFAGCCWGGRCELPWAVTFPAVYSPKGEVLGFAHHWHVQYEGLLATAGRSFPVHPSQLYEALALTGILLFLLWYQRRQRFDGQLFLAYLFLYTIARFCLEFLRGDAERGFFMGVSTSQILSIGVFGLAAFLWFQRRNMPLTKCVPATVEEPEKPSGKKKKNSRRKR